jgi:alkane 1-monooxygenase
MSDYVQHYGLTRKVGPDCKPAAVAPQHSWNAPHWFSALVMLNAARHSDHHAHPARVFPALGLPQNGAVLPHSLAVMGFMALAPRRWRAVMHPLLEAHIRKLEDVAGGL